ncbi:MAG: helix-turn-helix domain-containing protein [Phototrophicaceae bacterium]
MDPAELGQRIRAARERLGLSQEELAALIKRDQRGVSEYERGQRRLAAVDIPLLAQALQVPILYLYEGVMVEDEIDHQVLGLLHKLPSLHEKQAVVDILRILVDTLKHS